MSQSPGLKSNTDYLKMILSNLDICGISEHWLHHYDLSLLSKVRPEFHAYSMCSKSEEDVSTCIYPKICAWYWWSLYPLAQVFTALCSKAEYLH